MKLQKHKELSITARVELRHRVDLKEKDKPNTFLCDHQKLPHIKVKIKNMPLKLENSTSANVVLQYIETYAPTDLFTIKWPYLNTTLLALVKTNTDQASNDVDTLEHKEAEDNSLQGQRPQLLS
ncbi:hypothetical protein ACO22_03048 [Paracoccidioides brasiliensis]|uniref:Uncharacterized protein n=1 Tax=Paracoccidioides brasiliensis TaxID=121759 RepID=A0A1D2JH94_PARBR|nr:hypothetical protein ACO22_03048 [Paracoccidioides brasiliensis]ODH48547.1 hypothetical protein GX48_05310 [Paracoccidioides brasiliensis]